MKAVLSSCILRCLLGRRSTRPKRNDIKEQQRLPKPAPMTERRRRGASVFDFYNISYNAGYTKYRGAKKPSFSGFWPFRRLLSLFSWLSRFFAFCTVVLFECIALYVWSAFLFYNRPAVVCKNFSDFNSHHFLIPAAHIFQERSVCAVPSIISQLKLLIFLVKSQNLWNVLKSKRPHRITFEKSCGFIRVHSYRQGSKHPPGNPPVRHPQRPPSGRPVHHFQTHPMKDRQIPPCSPLSPSMLYPSLPS